MKVYTISIHGCDDSTIFDMELSDEEAALVERICERVESTSTYGCMPIIVIEPNDTDPR